MEVILEDSNFFLGSFCHGLFGISMVVRHCLSALK
jgi:hypothetical protein